MARKNYTDEFRHRAVDLYESTPGATLKGIAENLGISRGALKEWVEKHGAGTTTAGTAAPPAPGRAESQAAKVLVKSNQTWDASGEVWRVARLLHDGGYPYFHECAELSRMSSDADAAFAIRERFRNLFCSRFGLGAALALVAVVYGVYALSRVAQNLPAGYDLGIFDQAVRAYAHFSAPFVSLKGEHFNLLGDHFHPILVLIAPLYWIWDDARVLLLVQAVLIAISCWPVWRIAHRRFSTVAAAAFVAAYAIGWPLQALVDFDFHAVAFALPLLAWALDALDDHRDRGLLAAAGLLLLVREDMGAIVLLLGVLRAVRRPRWPGIGMIVLGAGAFAVILTAVIPAFAGGAYGYWQYSVLGADAGDALHTLVTDPGRLLTAFFTPIEKSWTLIALFGPLLLLPLASPYTLVALPLLAQRFLADRESLWGLHFHYNAPVWVILAIAAIDGAGRLIRLHRRRKSERGAVVIAVIIAAIPVLCTAVIPDAFPLLRLGHAAWVQTAHMAQQRDAVAAVPAGICVTVDDRLAPLLSRSNRVAIPGIPAPKPGIALIDLSEPEAGRIVSSADEYARLRADGYHETQWFGSIALLTAPHPITPSGRCTSGAP